MEKNKIIVATRTSELALVQSQIIIAQLHEKHPHLEFELLKIKTKGDLSLDTRLDLIGGKGLFVSELEHAILRGDADMAVHSLKDIPAALEEGLCIAAVSKREDPRDVLVNLDGKTLNELPAGAVIGTSSLRREVQVLQLRPDVQIKPLRGNVPTRLQKLKNGEYDAIILAAAGLLRLGLSSYCTQYFEPTVFIPAICQGILGIETKINSALLPLLRDINCPISSLQMLAERTFMKSLGGGCSTPMAAHAVVYSNRISIYGILTTSGKNTPYYAHVEGMKEDVISLANALAEKLEKASQRNDITEGELHEKNR